MVRTMMMVVPMSGSSMTRPATSPTIRTKGTKPMAKLLTSRLWEVSQAET